MRTRINNLFLQDLKIMIANETGLPVKGLCLSAGKKDLPDCFELKQLRDLGESSDKGKSFSIAS